MEEWKIRTKRVCCRRYGVKNSHMSGCYAFSFMYNTLAYFPLSCIFHWPCLCLILLYQNLALGLCLIVAMSLCVCVSGGANLACWLVFLTKNVECETSMLLRNLTDVGILGIMVTHTWFLLRDPMHKRGFCCCPVSVSVHQSVTLMYCIHTAEDIVKLLCRPDSPIILVFDSRHRYPIPRGTPSAGAQNTRGWEYFVIFNWNCRLSRKQYEIGP